LWPSHPCLFDPEADGDP
jgi:predicted DNA-binding protein (MmcQ/YjbR family)